MAVSIASSSIVTDGLLLCLDASDTSNYILSEVEVLVVGGGGGGGSHHGGGGGGGGVVYNNRYVVTPGSAILVTVGNGGSGGPAGAPGGTNRGGNGENSVFGVMTAIGGGGGANYPSSGASGGSGGAATNWGVTASGGSGTAGQGFAGSNGSNLNNYGGGGGGAGEPGGKGLAKNNGGDGLPFYISGTLTYYGGGGGAGYYPGYTFDGDRGRGGLGGGGYGGDGPHNGGTNPKAGTPNTGGGGGGVADLYKIGGAGGSGVVIVRYPGPQKATGGNIITQLGGYTIHTFTSSGTFTPLSAPTNSGTVYGLQDLSGNNNSCVSVNGPTYNTIAGGCINFDGIDDYMSSLTSRKYLDVTIVFRPDFSAVNQANIAGIIAVGASGDKSLRFQVVDGTGPWSVAARNPGDANDWAGIAGGATTYYVNGSVSNTLVSGWNIFGGYRTNQTTFPLEFPYHLGTSSYPGRYFKGQIAVVLMYNRQLTQAEQLQNFNALRGRFGI